MKRSLSILIFCLVVLNLSATTLTVDSLKRTVLVIDSLNFDEEDYFALMESRKKPARNEVKEREAKAAKELQKKRAWNSAYVDTLGEFEKPQVDLRDYALKDVYTPSHQTFDKHWYDHIYVGGGLGAEWIAPQCDDYTYKTFATVNAHVGKQFTKYSNARLALFGGWGYQKDTELGLGRIGLKADYLYNLSTLVKGYNPARRLEVSLLAGLGAHYAWQSGSGGAFAPEGHIGVQLKCYTGPQGVINIEPYIGIGSDNTDMSGTRNYHGYDIFYGVGMSYSCFTSDNLSPESRLKLLQNRMADERMVDPQTVERWRAPWFFEYAVGPAMTSSDALSFGSTLGSQISLSAGKWFSPAIGMRITGSTRTTQWMDTSTDSGTGGYNSNYVYCGIDLLLNPLGLLRSFRWNASWGAFLTFGGGLGSMTKYKPDAENIHARSESYRIGVHAWGRISEDLQAFVEPYYGANIYTTSNSDGNNLNTDHTFGVNIGVTMLIRSHRYRDLYEMDNTQDYTYRQFRGVRVGMAGGMPIIQNRSMVCGGMGMNWNALAFAEYRFNRLHSIRLMAEFLGVNTGAVSESAVEKINRTLYLGSVDYMVNLTNLCSGRFIERRVELDGFIGPTVGGVLTNEHTMMYGFNLGLKLSAHIWRGISAFLTPTSYMLGYSGTLPGLNPVGIGSMHLIHTINLGVQYKIGSLHFNAEKKRHRYENRMNNWREKLKNAEQKYQMKQNKRLERLKD